MLCPAPTLIPCRAVITPTESTLVTSSYVIVPPTDTFPVKLPLVAVTLVTTPVTLRPSGNRGAPLAFEFVYW